MTQLPLSAKTLGSSVTVSMIWVRMVNVPYCPTKLSTRCVTTPKGDGTALTSRSTVTSTPESENAPEVENCPSAGPSGLVVLMMRTSACDAAATFVRAGEANTPTRRAAKQTYLGVADESRPREMLVRGITVLLFK